MYKVTIRKIETEVKRTKEYQKVSDSGNEKDNGAVYDYVGDTKTVEKEVLVYNQDLEELDIPELVVFINKGKA